MENRTLVEIVYHPKTRDLSYRIYRTVHNGLECYYFDWNGDFYNTEWCNNPLQDCIKDAKDDLNSRYTGSYYKGRERHDDTAVFRAMS